MKSSILFMFIFGCNVAFCAGATTTTVTKKFKRSTELFCKNEGDVTLAIDSKASDVTIVARYPKEYAKYIIAKADGEAIVIGVKQNIKKRKNFFVEFTVTVPSLKMIDISGAFDFKIEPFDTLSALTIRASGSYRVDGTTGSIEALHLDFSGAGAFDFSKIDVVDASVSIFGSGDIELNVDKSITGDIMGSATITNYGKASTKEVGGSFCNGWSGL